MEWLECQKKRIHLLKKKKKKLYKQGQEKKTWRQIDDIQILMDVEILFRIAEKM